MNTKEIIEMAKQAGFHLNMWQLSLGCEASGTLDELEAFAKLVAQNEREVCIDIVAMFGGSVEIEAAIRARGQA